MSTYRNYRHACQMGRARGRVCLEVQGKHLGMSVADRHSNHPMSNRHHGQRLPNDRCYLNLRRCFALVEMPNPDVFSANVRKIREKTHV